MFEPNWFRSIFRGGEQRGARFLRANRILQADIGRAALRRRAARSALAASAAVFCEYLNDLKSMTKRISDANECNIIGYQIRRLADNIRKDIRGRHNQLSKEVRH